MPQEWKRGEHYPAIVTAVFDGDTVKVEWSVASLRGIRPDRIRLAGIDAAEMFPRPSQAAATAKLALSVFALWQTCVVVPTRSWPDCYGRIIARLLIHGVDASTELLRQGVVTKYNPVRRQARAVIARESRAQWGM